MSAAALADRADLYARYLILSKAAEACGIAAVLVGLATFFGGISSTGANEVILGLATLTATAVIAAISVDTTARLGDGPDIESEVRRHRDFEDLARLRRAADTVWTAESTARPAWFPNRVGHGPWVAVECLHAAVLTSGGLATLLAFKVLSGAGGWMDALGGCLALVALASGVVAYVGVMCTSTVLGLLYRDFVAVALMTTFGVVVAGLWALELLAIFVGGDGSAFTTALLAVAWLAFLAVPVALCVRPLRVVHSRSSIVPGISLRWLIRAGLLLRIASLQEALAIQSEGVNAPPAPRRSPLGSWWTSEVGGWYRRATGQAPVPPTGD